MSFLYPHTAIIKQYGGVTQNDEGALIPSALTTYRTGVQCDLQIASMNAYSQREYGITGNGHLHTVFIKPDSNVKRKNIIIINGTQYEVLGVEPFSSHYELTVNEQVI